MDGVPSSIANRVQWRPAGLASAESLAESLSRRRSAFLDRAQRVSAWYERFFRRVQPFRGWTTMPFDFGVPSEYVKVERRNAVAARQGPLSANIDSRQQQPQRETSSLPVRPPIRLAILGATAEDVAMRSESDQGRVAAIGSAQLSLALVSHAARTRREIRGGFPREADPVAAPSSAARQAPRAAEAPAPQNVEAEMMPRSSTPVVAPAPLSTPASPAIRHESRESNPLIEPPATIIPTTKSVVEQLVEQMVFPTPLPGLELRVIRRDGAAVPAKAESIPNRDAPTAENAHEFGKAAPKPSAPPTPSVIDVNAIADKVYRKLVRNQQRARERKGLY